MEHDIQIMADDLPVTFQVKYLGHHAAKGLWGIKHTRKPVDLLVETAKNLPRGKSLPLVKVEISKSGLCYYLANKKSETSVLRSFKVETISYGVQDLIYTKVFCMIIVNDQEDKLSVPFECYAFVCDSKNQARQLTHALAAAFQDYGKKVKEENKTSLTYSKKFAIDLRTPEELEEAENNETDA